MSEVLYTEEEYRMRVLPLAVTLVNTEVQRVLNNCNTKVIATITGELVNIIKYGVVDKPETVLVPESKASPKFA